MIPKRQRLSRKDISVALKSKSAVYTGYFTLRYIPISGCKDTPSRFSFVVSKKVAKKAVVRNILRRIGYNFVKDKRKDIPLCFSCVIFFKKTTANLSRKEIKEELRVLFEKARLIIHKGK